MAKKLERPPEFTSDDDDIIAGIWDSIDKSDETETEKADDEL